VFDLSGKVALVTGAGRGVGAGIVRRLAARGAAVAVNDIDPERAQATAGEVVAAGGRAVVSIFDVADHGAVSRAVAEVASQLGDVDILVNNAGVPAQMDVRPFRRTTPEQWRPYVDLNIYGVMNCCRAVIDGMCARRWGRVITISSGAAMVGMSFGVSSYAAGKGGAVSFMRHLALECAAEGVTANSVALGLIDNQPDPEVTRALARSVPVGRLGRPDEIGALCVYLASDEASWMTGQTIQLNGGSVTS
jgi:NAD(P)-dependent dehydrogenase (short-subunit alcohol dehydrogenase family)